MTGTTSSTSWRWRVSAISFAPAEKLKVDHTTVSRRVRELERSLNSTLFKRSKSGFALTEIGLRLLQFAEGMESQANSMVGSHWHRSRRMRRRGAYCQRWRASAACT